MEQIDRKRAIIGELEQHGVVIENLAAEVGKDFDPFDLILHVAYDQKPLTRRERAEKVRKRNYFAKYGDAARAVLQALRDKYQDEEVINMDGRSESPESSRRFPPWGRRCSW